MKVPLLDTADEIKVSIRGSGGGEMPGSSATPDKRPHTCTTAGVRGPKCGARISHLEEHVQLRKREEKIGEMVQQPRSSAHTHCTFSIDVLIRRSSIAFMIDPPPSRSLAANAYELRAAMNIESIDS